MVKDSKFYRKWSPFVYDVLDNTNNNYEYVRYPFSGGVYEQDDDVMDIWESIREKIIIYANSKKGKNG